MAAAAGIALEIACASFRLVFAIARLAQGALASVNAAPSQSATGHMLLDWNPATPGAFYLVTISSDAEGDRILRRYLTNKATLDLHAVENRLVPGQVYYCRVDVYSQWGDYLFLPGRRNALSNRAFPGPRGRPAPAGEKHETAIRLAHHDARLGYFDLSAQIVKEAPPRQQCEPDAACHLRAIRIAR